MKISTCQTLFFGDADVASPILTASPLRGICKPPVTESALGARSCTGANFTIDRYEEGPSRPPLNGAPERRNGSINHGEGRFPNMGICMCTRTEIRDWWARIENWFPPGMSMNGRRLSLYVAGDVRPNNLSAVLASSPVARPSEIEHALEPRLPPCAGGRQN